MGIHEYGWILMGKWVLTPVTMHRGQRRASWVLLYQLHIISLVTGSLSEPGARLVASRPQQFPAITEMGLEACTAKLAFEMGAGI